MAIQPDIQQQLYDLLTRSSNVAFVSSDQDSNVRIGLTPGQRVTAQVLLTLPDNRVQVQIGSQKLNLNIPMEVRQGQNLEMTFISEDPRSTFAIARQGGVTPPVSLSDASRLLGLLVGSEKIMDPGLRSSLQSINDMLRRSAGEAGVLTNLLDDVLTYGPLTKDGLKAAPSLPEGLQNQTLENRGNPEATLLSAEKRQLTPEQARLAAFETNAARILQQVARNSRFILVEAVNQPVTPLPLMPGEEVDAAVTGALPGGRAFVRVAGTPLELVLPRNVEAGSLLRLTFLSSQPKPLFALARTPAGVAPGVLSEAGRWLSVVEHSAGGASNQQMYVLERLNTVLKNLPPDSPAFTAILDEAITYDKLLQGERRQMPQELPPPLSSPAMTGQPSLQPGSGITIGDDMARLLQALIKGNRLALLEALNQQSPSSGFMPGQQLKGEVMAALGGGRFMVRIGQSAFEFLLPKGIRQGDGLNFFFISDEPQATFLMTRFGRPGEAQVSGTGRWLSSLSGSLSGRVTGETAPAPGLLRTLLSAPPLDAGQVSSRLQQGLRDSGMFYESHLARWFSGDYQLEQLLREPQGQLSHLRLPHPPVPGESLEELARATLKTGSMEVMQEVVRRAGGTAAGDEGGVSRQTFPVVREQLETLQSGQIVYRGELFPGQQMEWSVQERDARSRQQDNGEQSWESELRFDFPSLGRIRVQLSLEGNRIGVSVAVADAASTEVLDAGKTQLAGQLEAAGLLPAGIGVRHVDL